MPPAALARAAGAIAASGNLLDGRCERRVASMAYELHRSLRFSRHRRDTRNTQVWRVNWTNQVIMVQVNYRGLSPKQVFELYYGRRV